MRIVLLRHGIAIDRDHPDCPPDPERFLTSEGQQRTRRAVKGLRRLDVRPDLVLSSPWTRAVETATLAIEGLRLDDDVLRTREDLLPDSDPASVATHVRGLDGECTLVVGHAPHLDGLLANLLGGSSGSMSSLKKSGAASIVLTGGAGAELEWLATPKMLRRLART